LPFRWLRRTTGQRPCRLQPRRTDREQVIAQNVSKDGLAEGVVLNVNIPYLSVENMKGIIITRQGLRVYRDALDRASTRAADPITGSAARRRPASTKRARMSVRCWQDMFPLHLCSWT
jgi:broad specificity polyphosphatase/5'/3'-nucleotidase SurE